MGPKVFREKLKDELCKRVDMFCNETKKQSGTTRDWMIDFLCWSENQKL